MSHRETNPHFSRPLRSRHEDHLQRTESQLPGARPQSLPLRPREPLERTRLGDQPSQSSRPRVKIQEPSSKRSHGYKPRAPVVPPSPTHQPYDRHHQPLANSQHHEEQKPPPGAPVPPPKDRHVEPSATPQRHPQQGHHHSLRVPTPAKTGAHWWFLAVFCAIFWLVIIIGGLIVLIVYLVFRPQSPRFDVSSVTLNAAYLDLGYLLNADVTVLANFTNPNKKVHVDFSSMNIYLYYGSTLIATQYVEPFSAAKAESRFASIHMITSQVQLPLKETQRLVKQLESNGVIFEVRGVFRARSKLGSILRYSYNLYGLCSIMVTRPPDGVLIRRKCRTKR